MNLFLKLAQDEVAFLAETGPGAKYICKIDLDDNDLVKVQPGLYSKSGLNYFQRFAGPIPKAVEDVKPLPDASAAYFYNGGSI